MCELKIFGIDEFKIVNTALCEYRKFLVRYGNSTRASKVLEIINHLNSRDCVYL